MHSDGDGDVSIGGLVRSILLDIRTLIQEEITLARVEIREQAGRARTAAVAFGVAAASLAFGGAFLLVAIATAIADLLNWPVWAGFLVVAAVLSLIGLMALATGRRTLQAVQAVPHATMTTLKENSEWIANRLSSERK